MRVTQLIAENVKNDYLKDPEKDWKEIAKDHNITRDQVKKVLITYGIYSDGRTELIKNLIDQGYSTKEIAEKLFLSRESIALLTPYDFSEKHVYLTHAIKSRKEIFDEKPYQKRRNIILDCLLIKIISDDKTSYSIIPGVMPLRLLRSWIKDIHGIDWDNEISYFEFEATAAAALTSETANIWRKLVGIVFYSPHYKMPENIHRESFAGPYDDIIEENSDTGMVNDPLTKQTFPSKSGKAEISFDGLMTDQVQTLYKENIFRVIETLSVFDVIGNANVQNSTINSRVLRSDNPAAKGVLHGLTDTILFRCGDKTVKIINSTLSTEHDVMALDKQMINFAVRKCQTECIPVKLDL